MFWGVLASHSNAASQLLTHVVQAMPSWESLGIVITEEPTLTGAVTVCERDFPTAMSYNLWANTSLSIATPSRLRRISTGTMTPSSVHSSQRLPPADFCPCARYQYPCMQMTSRHGKLHAKFKTSGSSLHLPGQNFFHNVSQQAY